MASEVMPRLVFEGIIIGEHLNVSNAYRVVEHCLLCVHRNTRRVARLCIVYTLVSGSDPPKKQHTKQPAGPSFPLVGEVHSFWSSGSSSRYWSSGAGCVSTSPNRTPILQNQRGYTYHVLSFSIHLFLQTKRWRFWPGRV